MNSTRICSWGALSRRGWCCPSGFRVRLPGERLRTTGVFLSEAPGCTVVCVTSHSCNCKENIFACKIENFLVKSVLPKIEV